MAESYLDLQPTDTTTVFSLADLGSMIRPLVESYGMRWARIFGSYARGEADGMSDIDVLVDRGSCGFLDLCSLADDIYRASGKLSDVYDITELKEGPFREEVLREAVALVCGHDTHNREESGKPVKSCARKRWERVDATIKRHHDGGELNPTFQEVAVILEGCHL